MEKHLLDLSGEVRPMTWARTRNALARLEQGQLLEVVVDEGKPSTELPRSASYVSYLVDWLGADGRPPDEEVAL